MTTTTYTHATSSCTFEPFMSGVITKRETDKSPRGFSLLTQLLEYFQLIEIVKKRFPKRNFAIFSHKRRKLRVILKSCGDERHINRWRTVDRWTRQNKNKIDFTCTTTTTIFPGKKKYVISRLLLKKFHLELIEKIPPGVSMGEGGEKEDVIDASRIRWKR